nr:MAG TPA: Helix-turn-helix XRE-family like protein [Caudoviricetes sp.]
MWLDALKEMKQKSGMTTIQIAAGAGVPRPTLEKIFSGETKDPRLPTMQKVVHFLGYTLEDLYKDQKENPPAPSEDEEGELTVDEVISAFVSAGLVSKNQDLTDEDLRFFISIIDAIDSWFSQRNNSI